MDSVTHIVIGALQGELLAGKKLGKKAMLWGAAANSLPDIDVFFSSFQSAPDSLLSHRGFTHSILFAVLMSPLLGYAFNNWYKSHQLGFKRWTTLFALGMFTHIFIDSLTSYGTGWFEPFSHYRVSFNTIFVVDPFYTLPLLVAAVALLILRRSSTKRTAWAYAGLGLSCLYLLFTFYNKYKVDSVIEENIVKQQIPSTDYFTTPTPLNNFLWYAVVKESKQYQLGYYSIFDHQHNVPLLMVPQNDSLLNNYRQNDGVQKLLRFSRGYYCLTKDSTGVDFNDLCFGQIGGWVNPKSGFMFSYNLKPGADNNMVVQRGRMKGVNKQAFGQLIDRIKGN